MRIQTESLDIHNLSEARQNLSEHKDTLQSLINNLKEHGNALAIRKPNHFSTTSFVFLPACGHWARSIIKLSYQESNLVADEGPIFTADGNAAGLYEFVRGTGIGRAGSKRGYSYEVS